MARTYVALIGDAVGSRELSARARTRLQADLGAALIAVNRRWRREIAARFAVTLGDQFQGLLSAAEPLWDLSHWLRAELPPVDWILAAGRGAISTALAKSAPEVDGPCFHLARDALEQAKRSRLVAAFAGFASGVDGFAAYYSALYWSWTPRQRRTAALLRAVGPAETAVRLDVGRSAVSHLARRMGWRLVERGDRLFQEALTS